MWFELTKNGKTFGRTTQLDEESKNLDSTAMSKPIIAAEKLIKTSKIEESKNPKKWIIPVETWQHLFKFHTNSEEFVAEIPNILIIDTYPCYDHRWIAFLDSNCCYIRWTKSSQDFTYKGNIHVSFEFHISVASETRYVPYMTQHFFSSEKLRNDFSRIFNFHTV